MMTKVKGKIRDEEIIMVNKKIGWFAVKKMLILQGKKIQLNITTIAKKKKMQRTFSNIL